MKIAFLHYHLKTGGVTTVIRQQVEALRKDHDVMVLTGEPPETQFHVTTVLLQGLGYDRLLTTADTPKGTAEAVKKAIGDVFGGRCDVLHVHNPLLAKNKNLLKILSILQQKGVRLFLQIHDFAEDGRPRSYYSEDKYPSNCHYGVINSRDHKFLKASGVGENGLHRIDNIITPYPANDGLTGTGDLILYPVRAIRRKNIGEAILLSCFFNEDETLFITQPPNSRDDLDSYNGWKAFARENRLRIEFEAGLESDYIKLVNRAKYMITTSISEGFGFLYLEPWTADKGLWGRKLTGVCDDFESNRLNLGHLYSEIRIPLDWIEASAFKNKWLSAHKRAYALFGQSVPESTIHSGFDKMAVNGNLDFGLLDEANQKDVISRLLSDERNKERLIRRNAPLSQNVMDILDDSLIRENKNAVLKNYNQVNYANRLINIYQKVVRQDVFHSIDKSALFAMFMKHTRFSLLKWSPYIG